MSNDITLDLAVSLFRISMSIIVFFIVYYWLKRAIFD